VRLARDASWILFGVLLGTGACFAIVHGPVSFAAMGGARLGTLTVFILLARSTQRSRSLPPLLR
jgi:hypothetical protein